jgi:hypothetical protein
VNRIPKSWVAVIAVLAAFGVLFVLITPALDELPTTGPHALVKVLPPTSVAIYLPFKPLLSDRSEAQFGTLLTTTDLLAVLCTRLN